MVTFHKILCNGRENPACIDKPPVFSWNYTSGCDRNITQKGYSVELLDADGRVLLAQNKRGSGTSYVCRAALAPLTDYCFRVTARMSDGQVLESPLQHFSTGLLGENMEQWGAKWIAGSQKYETAGLAFRRTWTVAKPVRRARAYLFATAWQRVEINGVTVREDCHMLPANSAYQQRCLYEMYELPLRQGENTLQVLTGGGYNGSYSCFGWRLKCGKMLIGFVQIDYADGTAERIVTDESWELYSSPVTQCDIYDGECYDARVVPEKLENACVAASPVKKAVFQANEMPPVKVVRQVEPVSCRKDGSSRLYDMGENFAGVAKISLRAPRGTRITLQFSELVYNNGDQRTTTNCTIRARDEYICSGEGLETYMSEFTYHGYRYVKVSGLSAAVRDFQITGMALSAGAAWESRFVCSDGVINTIHANALRSLQSNLMAIPTDCPSRGERTPCAMDSQCVEIAGIWNFDLNAYYRKWLEDILLGADTANDHGNPDWDGDKILLAHRLLTYYNDREALARYYKPLKKCMQMFARTSQDGLWPEVGFGDWCHPNENTWESFHSCVKVVNTCLHYQTCRAMEEIAAVLGKTADAADYSAQAAQIQRAFVAAYLKDDGTVNDGIHTEQVLALDCGILPEDRQQQVLEKLCRQLEAEPMDLGIFGIAALARVLPRYGKTALLRQLLRQPEYPGYLYCIVNGATSMWEEWAFDGRMASHNHAMFAGIDEAFYGGFAGIRPLEHGFARFQVAPQLPQGMDFVDCAVETAAGVIRMAYHVHAAGTELKLSVPANTRAEVRLPWLPGQVLHDGEVIVPAEAAEGTLRLTLGSGNYRLRLVEGRLLFENTFENRFVME